LADDIDSKGFFRRCFRFRRSLALGNRLVVRSSYVIISQASIRVGIARIFFNRLVEEVFRLFERLWRALPPIVDALEIKLISLGIVRATLGHLSFRFAR
jgi:hypothetical protein